MDINTIKKWVEENNGEIVAVGSGIIMLAVTARALTRGIKINRTIPGAIPTVVKEVCNEAKDVNSGTIKNAERYLVQLKAFKTGDWYDKTLTNSKAAAYSVANTSTWGRASRVIDTVTGAITCVQEGAPEIYKEYGVKL